MTILVTAVVMLGLAVVLGLALQVGVDAAGAILLTVIFGLGALGVAVARRARTRAVAPTTCRACGGLVSSNAPYCKHCGAPVP